RQEVTAGAALDEPALHQRPRALLLPDLDVLEVFAELAGVDYRSDLGVVSQRVADAQRTRLGREGLDEAVIDAVGHDHAAGSRAALARREVRAVDHVVDG